MRANYRVLVVEDDADTLELLRLGLRPLPLDVSHAATGAAAIDYLAREVPDLLFLDLHLPDMRGWDVLDRFKADARFSQLAVVVLTAHHDPVHRLIGLLQPVSAFLRKPVAADALRAQVRALLDL